MKKTIIALACIAAYILFCCCIGMIASHYGKKPDATTATTATATAKKQSFRHTILQDNPEWKIKLPDKSFKAVRKKAKDMPKPAWIVLPRPETQDGPYAVPE